MSLLSIEFFCFLIGLLFLYYMVPVRLRWIVLLAGSVAFYMFSGWKYLILVIFTTVTTFLAAGRLEGLNGRIKEDVKKLAEKEERKRLKEKLVKQKKGIVAAVLITNFAILMLFKTPLLRERFSLLLPLGISFYTFQTIGYMIDVYRGKFSAEKNIFKYAVFTIYFPQIIQGPINRYQELAPQLTRGNELKWKNIKYGAELFLWGMFKKLVISDRAAIFVNTVFGQELEGISGSVILIGVFLFNIQLYGDFSGGIDMVRGISEMLGIEMTENFRRPFFSRSLGEYWRRWHISLGTWIKDYVFYPLAMSKLFASIGSNAKKKLGNHMGKTLPGGIASVITFVLIGIWHDIGWYYVVYGLWHGIIMALSSICAPLLRKGNDFFCIRTDCLSFRWFQRFRTWMLVTIGEYFSLSGNMKNIGIMFQETVKNFKYRQLFYGLGEYGLDGREWVVLGCGVLMLIFVSMKQESGVRIREALERQNLWFQWIAVVGVVFLVAVFGIYGPGYDAASFIYGGF